jgi:hypothetical protein
LEKRYGKEAEKNVKDSEEGRKIKKKLRSKR